MKFLLIAIILFATLTCWTYRSAQRGSPDDFGAAFPVIASAVVTVLLIVAYVIWALWAHRVW